MPTDRRSPAEDAFPRAKPPKVPTGRLRRFVWLARRNHMVGGGWKASIRVAWMDSRR